MGGGLGVSGTGEEGVVWSAKAALLFTFCLQLIMNISALPLASSMTPEMRKREQKSWSVFVCNLPLFIDEN